MDHQVGQHMNRCKEPDKRLINKKNLIIKKKVDTEFYKKIIN